jgi:hypothetical protein
MWWRVIIKIILNAKLCIFVWLLAVEISSESEPDDLDELEDLDDIRVDD